MAQERNKQTNKLMTIFWMFSFFYEESLGDIQFNGEMYQASEPTPPPPTPPPLPNASRYEFHFKITSFFMNFIGKINGFFYADSF